MKKSELIRLLVTLCIPALACAAAPAPHPPRPIVATIDAARVARPISPYEYGMFIEHIGSLIYRSLWSEMLDDRKFYYPISPMSAPSPAGPRFLRMLALRHWRPVGPAAAVVMDRHDPFVGEQSPHVELSASIPHGKLLGAAPYITVNAGFGDAHSAAEGRRTCRCHRAVSTSTASPSPMGQRIRSTAANSV